MTHPSLLSLAPRAHPSARFRAISRISPLPNSALPPSAPAWSAPASRFDRMDEVFFGCVLPAGLGQAPARQAALGAGLPASTGAVTINKMCGSGMKAVMLAHDLLLAGSARIIVAGGMESMSNAPYLLDRARGGYRMGHGRVLDHMFLDGLEDAYDKGRLMGAFAEDCAQSYAFTREAQDEYAAGVAGAGAKSHRQWQLCRGDRSRHGEGGQDRTRGEPRRAAAESNSGKDSASEAGVSRRRNGDRGKFQRASPMARPRWC